ncbi:MAG: energy transducer TonB family protein [Gemmatimonadota bacterium]
MLFWRSVVAAAVVHGLVLWLSSAVRYLPSPASPTEPMDLVPPAQERVAPDPPPYIAPPAVGAFDRRPPEEITRPAAPIVADAGPPPASGSLREIMDGPVFTPYEVAPELMNRSDLTEALLRSYPYDAPGVPVRSRTVMWFLIDEYGSVRRTVLRESSGYAAVDTAMLGAVRVAQFSPAWFRDRTVPVWVSLPIVLELDSELVGVTDTTGASDTTGAHGPSVLPRGDRR